MSQRTASPSNALCKYLFFFFKHQNKLQINKYILLSDSDTRSKIEILCGGGEGEYLTAGMRRKCWKICQLLEYDFIHPVLASYHSIKRFKVAPLFSSGNNKFHTFKENEKQFNLFAKVWYVLHKNNLIKWLMVFKSPPLSLWMILII